MKNDAKEPDGAPEERIEDLDVPESESEDLKGGFGTTTSTATGAGSYGATWGGAKK
jgi:hypothetical protein